MLVYLNMIDLPDDKIKFEDLYYKYRALMFYVANKILRNDQDAEDAVQQAFEAIAKHMRNIDAVDCPKTQSFVVTITENKAIDLYRARQRHQTVSFNDELLPDDLMGIEFPLPHDNGLADMMVKLPAIYREILLLRFDNGFTAREISTMLELSLPAVNKRIWRAKELLRTALGEEGTVCERGVD